MLDRNTADLNMPDGNIKINSAASLDFDFFVPNDSISLEIRNLKSNDCNLK